MDVSRLMTRAPKVTVLVPTYNRAHFLRECLDSLLCQSLEPWQLVVVDDGSTDGTAAVLESYGQRIEVVKIRQSGKPVAVNEGMRRATGDYLWIFDDDDVALPDALERFAGCLEDHPECGFAFSTFYHAATRPGDGRIGQVLVETLIPDLSRKGLLIALMEANFMGGAALMARRSCYERLGGYDSRLLRSQDYEMAIRLARHFAGVRVPGGATFYYRQHEGLRGSDADRFEVALRVDKWSHYNRIIFRECYRTMSLDEYLPPGVGLCGMERQACLQRFAILAVKMLWDEARVELERIARLADEPFTEMESHTLDALAWCMSRGELARAVHDAAILDQIRRFAVHSGSLRCLRFSLLVSMLRNWRFHRQWKSLRKSRKFIGKVARLYLPLGSLGSPPSTGGSFP